MSRSENFNIPADTPPRVAAFFWGEPRSEPRVCYIESAAERYERMARETDGAWTG
jgi:hypothetical protein